MNSRSVVIGGFSGLPGLQEIVLALLLGVSRHRAWHPKAKGAARMSEIAEKIGKNIQRLRKRTRWTQATLAKVTGIPKIENLAKLANAFNCSVTAIDARLAKVGMSGDEVCDGMLDDIDRAILAELESLPRRAKLQLLTKIGELRASLGNDDSPGVQ